MPSSRYVPEQARWPFTVPVGPENLQRRGHLLMGTVILEELRFPSWKSTTLLTDLNNGPKSYCAPNPSEWFLDFGPYLDNEATQLFDNEDDRSSLYYAIRLEHKYGKPRRWRIDIRNQAGEKQWVSWTELRGLSNLQDTHSSEWTEWPLAESPDDGPRGQKLIASFKAFDYHIVLLIVCP